MKLNVMREGVGPDLVLIHGWGMHSGIWKSIYPALISRFRLHLIDLPGHGYNHAREMPGTINELGQELLDVAPENAHWLGWSLGGMAAISAACHSPLRISQLILVASTPRFVQAGDWQYGVRFSALNVFLDALQDDYRATVQQFMALQVQGDEAARDVLRELRRHLFDHGDPSPKNLATGLKLLRDTDLRDSVARLPMPLLSITGSRDRLTPPQSGSWLAAQVVEGRHVDIQGAAHAPFISHPTEFVRAIDEFSGVGLQARQVS